jgi:hypothetical protein
LLVTAGLAMRVLQSAEAVRLNVPDVSGLLTFNASISELFNVGKYSLYPVEALKREGS